MSAVEETAGVAVPRVAARGPRFEGLSGNWWRHAIGILAIIWALFPVVYVISAAFNGDSTLNSASPIPHSVTLHNFKTLLAPSAADTKHYASSADYPHWYLNTVIVSASTAFLTVLLGAMAAYAFSRFRFRGRRLGMLFLLLIQMFPQLLAVVAIYLIVYNVGDIFHVIGLNTITGVIVVYLGGVMGVNTWLMKGFFDTIPSELDESARVDGATPAQVFWGVVLPLAAPVLAVIALLSFIGTINEYVIASVLLQTSKHQTLPVGLYNFINSQYQQSWGPFAAGVLLAAIPVVILMLSLQKFIVGGLTQGSVKG
jgi:arabinogalactan oligomer / maltooligosaccharide transport system permease protein